jgi:L-rhamnose mutarotase
MQRMGMAIRIRPEKLEEYRALHAAPWPEMDQALAQANIRNYSIWLVEDALLLFGYWEYVGQDYDADLARLGALPVTQRWLALTDPCQMPMTPDEAGWRFLPQLYQLGA